MKNESSILKELLQFFLKPKTTLSSILESKDFRLDKKKFLFIAVMSLYSLFLPSTLVFLLILVIPFVLIMIGFIYFLSQEISIVYFETQMKEYQDLFLYRVAYCLSLIAVPAMILSVFVNFFFLLKTDNFLFAGILSLAFAFLPLLISAFYLNMFMSLVSSGSYGLLKVIELSFVSLLSTLKAKFGWEVIEEIKADMENLDS
jgi:hypothetical protein